MGQSTQPGPLPSPNNGMPQGQMGGMIPQMAPQGMPMPTGMAPPHPMIQQAMIRGLRGDGAGRR